MNDMTSEVKKHDYGIPLNLICITGLIAQQVKNFKPKIWIFEVLRFLEPL